MASACFLREIQGNRVSPRIKFTYAGTDYSNYVKSISNLSRNDQLSAQYVTVVLQDVVKDWDTDFRTDHTELTKKVVISLAVGDLATYTANTISFNENAPNQDTIEDSADGLGVFGTDTVLTISGSDSNDKSVMIEGVTASALTLDNSDDLTNESAGDTITLTNELLTLYTGYVEEADINYADGEVTLKCRDRISLLLENVVSDISTELYHGHWNYFDILDSRQEGRVVSGIVWDLLTDYAFLSSTESSANLDIDYESWTAWATAVDNGGFTLYDIGVYLTGQASVMNILSAIAKLTVSQIWIGANGKLKFKASTQTIAGNEYTKSNVIGEFNMNVAMKGRVNYYGVKYKYIPEIDSWGSDDSGIYTHSHLYGPTDVPYTYTSEYLEDRDVFHNTVESATKYVDEMLLITAPPMRRCRLGMNLYGFVEDVGNEITLTDFYVGSPYDSIEVHLEQVTFDISNFIAILEGYYIWGTGELA